MTRQVKNRARCVFWIALAGIGSAASTASAFDWTSCGYDAATEVIVAEVANTDIDSTSFFYLANSSGQILQTTSATVLYQGGRADFDASGLAAGTYQCVLGLPGQELHFSPTLQAVVDRTPSIYQVRFGGGQNGAYTVFFSYGHMPPASIQAVEIFESNPKGSPKFLGDGSSPAPNSYGGGQASIPFTWDNSNNSLQIEFVNLSWNNGIVSTVVGRSKALQITPLILMQGSTADPSFEPGAQCEQMLALLRAACQSQLTTDTTNCTSNLQSDNLGCDTNFSVCEETYQCLDCTDDLTNCELSTTTPQSYCYSNYSTCESNLSYCQTQSSVCGQEASTINGNCNANASVSYQSCMNSAGVCI